MGEEHLQPSGDAPGWPGIEARWTSSAKDGVGTALGGHSRVWYAVSHGILNEVYYPRIDNACTRDLEFIVTDGDQFFSEEKRDTDSTIEVPVAGVPMFRITNRCRQGRYVLVKEVFSDPGRDCLVQVLHFEQWSPELKLHVLLSPHIGNQGMGNTAWTGEHKGTPLLFASRGNIAMALATGAAWRGRSAGFVGSSDGWQDLNRSKRLTWSHQRAADGNVALVGEIAVTGEPVPVVLGFGRSPAEAGHLACMTLTEPLNDLRQRFAEPWKQWHAGLGDSCRSALDRISATVLRVHEDKVFQGGTIASLSIPWGASKGDGDLGGYHLVWPRDLAETAGGFLAIGAGDEARRILHYLQATQEADGHWPQNQWLDGTPYWPGIQMDEVALPVLLVDLARRHGALSGEQLAGLLPMVGKAADYIITRGPVSMQDRWEEDSGCSPFTLSAEIAALVVAADLCGGGLAERALETADRWFGKIDDWTYAKGTRLATEHGVDGYYVRISPPEVAESGSPLGGFVPIKNRPPADACGETVEIVSPDALALVRFGLRAAGDPRIVGTVKVIDALLKRDFPGGPSWYRYNGDGYGEHEDGSPFDGTGRGRQWPLLTGERAHYELAAGRVGEAKRLAATVRGFANGSGLIPEQVWDGEPIPDRGLLPGKPAGSAMPLVWAHAEYLKLLRSLKDGSIFDLPPQVAARYLKQ
ncbi:glycoside hydrolase family 15 protein [Luteolibacter marinus]|uniref:glycoside hydrolase family 15 protein n=1 Tax=Luteolibacter marinus TaxID=2776705 RepID=UPI0018677AC7|nr:glycoside hydrolase family 15 protein [Luteolibacter marinus]